MKVSVIISACPNREILFERSLYTYTKQNFDKNNFEILLVDDGDNINLFNLCKEYNKNYKLKFQYIKVDKSKSFYPIESFTPALTNNVGIRLSLGDVIIITGPETLQAENNIKVAYSMILKNECAYGLVFRAAKKFNKYLENSNWKNEKFSDILKYPGAKADCRTIPPHPPAYWYCMAVAKKHILNINGVDERFLGGICGEDDDFSNRMKLSGINPIFNNKIIGIHQNHDNYDSQISCHNIRNTEKWNKLRNYNIKLMNENLKNNNYIVNNNHIWGNPNVITYHEVF